MRERVERALLILACLILALHIGKLLGCVIEARAGFMPASLVSGRKL